MHKAHLLNLIKLSNYYYKLARIKYAVPLGGEDDRGGIFVSDKSIFSRPDTTPFRFEEPENTVRENKLSGKSLPPYKEFKDHYSKTQLNYRIIYLKDFFNLKEFIASSLRSPTVEQYKNMISQYITKPSLDEEIVFEGKQLLENFDSIFSKDAINIVANTLTSEDEITPEAIDHDIGHNILDTREIYPIIESDFKQAFKADYQVISKGKVLSSKSMIEKVFDNSYGKEILTAIITHNKLPRGISSLNMARGTVEDIEADLIPIYNKNGETFAGLQFTGVNFYFDKDASSINLIPIIGNQIFNYSLSPIDLRIPNINKVIKKYLALVEAQISKNLFDLVGKVYLLNK